MAGTNEILTWAQGVGANVATQSAFNTATARTAGVGAGVADSSLYNKVTRQSAFVVAALSQWLVDQTGGSVLDNGDTANVKALLTTTVQTLAQALINSAGYATVGAMNAADNGLQAQITAEIAARSGGDSNLFNDYIARIAAEATARNNGDVTEANARYAGDQYLLGLLPNYVPKGNSNANNVRQNFIPGSGWVVTSTLSFHAYMPGYVFSVASLNPSGVLPAGSGNNLFVDGGVVNGDITNLPMTAVGVSWVAAGDHTVQQQFTAGAAGSGWPYVSMNLSFVFVPNG